MTAQQNPIAPEHLPFFITAPGQTDVLFNVVAVFVLLSVIGLGVIFLTIHSLPERIAHKSQKIQFDIVAILGLLGLLSHEHVFWVAALLLAFIDIPDFSTPVHRIVNAVETMARSQSRDASQASEDAESEKIATQDVPGVATPVSGSPAQNKPARKKGPQHA